MTNKIIAQKAIIKRGSRLLLLKRAEDEVAFPGLWDFPGGKLELGEDLKESVHREVNEETGLEIKVKDVIGKYPGVSNGRPVEFIIYDAEVVFENEVFIGEEHSEFQWLTIEEIKKLSAMPYMNDCLKDLEVLK